MSTTPDPQLLPAPLADDLVVKNADYMRWAIERLVDQRRSIAELVQGIQKRAFLSVAAFWAVAAAFLPWLRIAPGWVQVGTVTLIAASGFCAMCTIFVRGSWEMSPKTYWNDENFDAYTETGVLLTAVELHRKAVSESIQRADRRGVFAQWAQALTIVGVVGILLLALLGKDPDAGQHEAQPAASASPAAPGTR